MNQPLNTLLAALLLAAASTPAPAAVLVRDGQPVAVIALPQKPDEFQPRALTELVEQAVLAELDRISERGGVMGAMETGYQRGRIQDESMLYEQRKHDGTLPLIGVNTFRNPEGDETPTTIELARSSDPEKRDQIDRLHGFQERNAAHSEAALERLRAVALEGGNIFAELMHTVRHASLGQITDALFEVGGRYRRNV